MCFFRFRKCGRGSQTWADNWRSLQPKQEQGFADPMTRMTKTKVAGIHITVSQFRSEVGGFVATMRTLKRFPFSANCWFSGQVKILERIRDRRCGWVKTRSRNTGRRAKPSPQPVPWRSTRCVSELTKGTAQRGLMLSRKQSEIRRSPLRSSPLQLRPSQMRGELD
jgi:hypothetical protein